MTNDVKQKLIDAGLILDAADLGDFTRGHVSVRDPSDPRRFFMKPHSVGFEEITMEDIVICNLDGEKISGGKRHSEVFIHSEILRARPDLNAVVHCHPKYAVAFCSVDRPWNIVSQACAAFAEGIGIYDETMDLIRSQTTGRGVAEAMGKHYKAVFMRAHGVAVAGNSIEEVVVRTLTLERACEDQFLVQCLGGAFTPFPAHDIDNLRSNLDRSEQYIVNFDYLARRAKRSGTYGRP